MASPDRRAWKRDGVLGEVNAAVALHDDERLAAVSLRVRASW
jgi:hypothetical protein